MRPRKFIFLITLSVQLACNMINAQDFYPFRENEKTYFRSSTSGEYIAAIFDSVVTRNDTTFFYNYPIAQVKNGCIRMDHASWLGAEVFITNDILQIKNQMSDTLIIKYNAKLGEYWQVYKESPNKFVLGLVSNIQINSSINVTDTIKVITLTSFGYSGWQKEYIESRSIKIGTAFGFHSVFDFCSFPYSNFLALYYADYKIVGQGEKGIRPITMAEIMDLQPGEIFHYLEYLEHSPEYRKEKKEINKILDRNVNTAGDTLILKTERIIRTTIYAFNDDQNQVLEDTQFIHDTISKKYNIAFVEPLEPIMNNSGSFSAFRFFDWSDYMDRRRISKSIDYYPIGDSDCFDILTGNNKQIYYVEGLGEMYNNDDVIFEIVDQRKIVYYKKLDQEWGTPWNEHNLLSIEKEKLEEVRFYPVPFNTSINLKLPVRMSGQAQILFFDISGRIQLQQNVSSLHTTIDTKKINPGIYFYQLRLPTKEIKTGRLIKVNNK